MACFGDLAYVLPPVDNKALGALDHFKSFAKNLSSGSFDSGGSCLFVKPTPPREAPPTSRRPQRSSHLSCKKKPAPIPSHHIKLPSLSRSPWQPTLPSAEPITPLPDPRGVSIPIPRQFHGVLNYEPLSARELAMVRWDVECDPIPVVPKTKRPIVLTNDLWSTQREPGPPRAQSLPPRPKQQAGCLDEAIHQRIREMLMESGKPSLQWVTTDCDADYRNLYPGQFYNHFQNNHELTTKVGLHRSLEEFAMSEGESVNNFFPRCYDVTQRCERQDFILDFRRCAALGVIQQHLKLVEAKAKGYCCCLDVLRVAMHTLRRWVWDLDPEHLDEDEDGQTTPTVSDEWWDALVLYSELTSAQLCGENDDESSSRRRTRRHHRAGGGDLDEDELSGRTAREMERPQNFREWPEFKDVRWGEPPPEWQAVMTKLVQRQKDLYAQAGIQSGRNVWIVKPGTNSKGSGVICMNTLPELLHHCDAMTNRLVQKYIERPLLLFGGRKFDIRQWVLVTSVAPLKVYLFSECYLRLCNDVYNLGDLENRQSHISNWQVNKHGQNAIDGSVASLPTFEAELEKMTGNKHFWAEHLAPQMEHIVMSTMRSVQTRLVPRKECFELYGFDVMIDEDFKMWLLEVNLSPGCENRVPFIDQMIKRMSRRLIEVAVLGQEEPDGEPLDWIPIESEKSLGDARDPRDEAALRSGQSLPCVADLAIAGQQLTAPKRRKKRGYNDPLRKKLDDALEGLEEEEELSSVVQEAGSSSRRRASDLGATGLSRRQDPSDIGPDGEPLSRTSAFETEAEEEEYPSDFEAVHSSPSPSPRRDRKRSEPDKDQSLEAAEEGHSSRPSSRGDSLHDSDDNMLVVPD